MKLKIYDATEVDEPTLEFWLEQDDIVKERINVCFTRKGMPGVFYLLGIRETGVQLFSGLRGSGMPTEQDGVVRHWNS